MAVLWVPSTFFTSSSSSCLSISAGTLPSSLPPLRLRALRGTLRRCCSFHSLEKTRAVFCALRPEDGSENLDLEEASLRLPAESEPSLEHSDSSVTYRLVTGLAGLGFAETLYLTFMKLSGGAVSCPIGGGSCNDVLNSEYAAVFGLPLSALGVLTYGMVSLLGLLAISKISVKVGGVDLTRWFLLGITGAMASASAYFMYILSTKLEGASCAYCVASAFLSVSLLLLSLRVRGPFFGKPWNMHWKCMLKSFSSKEIKQVAGLQLAVTASVVVALSSAYADITPALSGYADIDLTPVELQVTSSSSPLNVSLAKHLQSVGAKMYGAFWCSHCFEQKQVFGREAVKYLSYVECYPEGYRRGVKIAKACEEANIQGFPTWIIKGKVLSGEQELSELAHAAGFDGFDRLNDQVLP